MSQSAKPNFQCSLHDFPKSLKLILSIPMSVVLIVCLCLRIIGRGSLKVSLSMVDGPSGGSSSKKEAKSVVKTVTKLMLSIALKSKSKKFYFHGKL